MVVIGSPKDPHEVTLENFSMAFRSTVARLAKAGSEGGASGLTNWLRGTSGYRKYGLFHPSLAFLAYSRTPSRGSGDGRSSGREGGFETASSGCC